MKARPAARLAAALVALAALAGCRASAVHLGRAQALEARGETAAAARAYEDLARRSSGGTAAEAWYRAGRLWADAANPERSYDRAIRCLRRVDRRAATTRTAREARSLLAALERGEEARSALADVDRSAEAVRR